MARATTGSSLYTYTGTVCCFGRSANFTLYVALKQDGCVSSGNFEACYPVFAQWSEPLSHAPTFTWSASFSSVPPYLRVGKADLHNRRDMVFPCASGLILSTFIRRSELGTRAGLETRLDSSTITRLRNYCRVLRTSWQRLEAGPGGFPRILVQTIRRRPRLHISYGTRTRAATLARSHDLPCAPMTKRLLREPSFSREGSFARRVDLNYPHISHCLRRRKASWTTLSTTNPALASGQATKETRTVPATQCPRQDNHPAAAPSSPSLPVSRSVRLLYWIDGLRRPCGRRIDVQHNIISYHAVTLRYALVYNIPAMSCSEKIQMKIHRPHVGPKSKIHWST